MSKSNIALAILAGAVVGGIVAIVITAEKALSETDESGEPTRFELIAGKFSDRFSSDLKKAEDKINSVTKRDAVLNSPEGDFGVFL